MHLEKVIHCKRNLTITIVRKNLILKIGYMYYTNSVFMPRSIFYKFFPENKQPQNLLCLFFFSGKLKFPRESRHLIFR